MRKRKFNNNNNSSNKDNALKALSSVSLFSSNFITVSGPSFLLVGQSNSYIVNVVPDFIFQKPVDISVFDSLNVKIASFTLSDTVREASFNYLFKYKGSSFLIFKDSQGNILSNILLSSFNLGQNFAIQPVKEVISTLTGVISSNPNSNSSPTYTSITSGVISPGQLVTITGTNFTANTMPVWVGNNVPAFTFVNVSTITFVAPAVGNYTVAGFNLAIAGAAVIPSVIYANPAYAHGDSFTAAQGASSFSTSYIGRLSTSLAINFTNRAVGGSQTNNGAARLLNNAVTDVISPTTLSLIALGYNDSRFSPNTETSKIATFNILAAMIAHAGIRTSRKQLGTAGTRVGFTFSNNPYPGAVSSNVAGDSWTGTFTGTTGYLCLVVSNSNGSRVTISVDGTSLGSIDTWIPASPVTESGGEAPRLIRLTGLSNTAHTVVVSVGTRVVGANASNVGVLWLAALDNSPTVAVLTPFPDNSTVPNRADWVQAIIDVSAVLKSDGLNVKLVRTDQLSVVSADFDPDTIHFSDLGYAKVATAVNSALNIAGVQPTLPNAIQLARLFPALIASGGSVPSVPTYSLYNNPTRNAVLSGTDNGSGTDFEVGTTFRTNVAGQITGLRFYKTNNQYNTRLLNLWSSTGSLLAQVNTGTEISAPGWLEVNLPTPVNTVANGEYTVSGRVGNGRLDTILAVNGVLPGTTPSQLTFLNGNTGTVVAAYPSTNQGASVFRQADVLFSV